MRDSGRESAIEVRAGEFHPIARRQRHRLGAATIRTQGLYRLPEKVPLTCLHIDGAMADADTEKIRIIARLVRDVIVLTLYFLPSLPQYSR
jgi:hypothetical protein